MLEKVMLTLDKAGYMEQTNGLSARIMNPLVNIFRAYADMPGVTENFLGKFMRQTSPSLLIAKAAAKYPERGWRVSLTFYLQDYITETLAAPVMFDSKGKKVIYLKTA